MIGILTWHNVSNHGAILQAYASQQTLNKLGCPSCFVPHEEKFSTTLPLSVRLSMKLKRIAGGEYRDARKRQEFEIQKRDTLNLFVEENLIVKGGSSYEDLDTLMIGSDMVFSLVEGYHPNMFGEGFEGSRLFSYAACGGGSTVEDARRICVFEELSRNLQRFSGLGCRDKETEDFVYGLTGSKDKIVANVDPVLLYGFKEELALWDSGKWSNHKPYLLIYSYYTNMNSKKEVNAIREYATLNGLSVVSVGFFHCWCDENVNASPQEFLEMVKNAVLVVTDTFHGTVFSMVTHTDFVPLIRDNGFKLQDLLNKAGMSSLVATPNTLKAHLSKKTEFSSSDRWLAKARAESLEYLRGQVK